MTSSSLACSFPKIPSFSLCHFKIPKKGKVLAAFSQLSGHRAKQSKKSQHQNRIFFFKSVILCKSGSRREGLITQNVNVILQTRIFSFFFFLHSCWDPNHCKMWFAIACAKALPAINLTHHCTFSQLFLQWQTWLLFSPRPSCFYFSLSFSLFPLSLRDAGRKVWWRSEWGTGSKDIGVLLFNRLPFFYFHIQLYHFLRSADLNQPLFMDSRFVSSTAGLPDLALSVWFLKNVDFTMADILPWPGLLWKCFTWFMKK